MFERQEGEETSFPTSACGRGVFFTVRYPERTPRPVCTGVGASKGEFFYSVWANQLNGWENRRENNHRPVIKLPLVRESVRRGWIWYQGPSLTSDYLEISTDASMLPILLHLLLLLILFLFTSSELLTQQFFNSSRHDFTLSLSPISDDFRYDYSSARRYESEHN